MMTETAESMGRRPPGQEAAPEGTGRAALAALGLIFLGDILLFGQTPGLNLFVFATAAMVGIVAGRFPHLPLRAAAGAFALCFAMALPLIEAPSIIASALAMIGLAILALTAARLFPTRPAALPLTLLRFAMVAPLPFVADIAAAMGRGFGLRLAHGLVVWTIPIGLALVFVALFWSANPVLADLFGKFNASTFDAMLDPWRMAFWLGIAVTAWALLQPRLKLWSPGPAGLAAAAPAANNLLFGRAAILRSLLVFNALFAIQTALDLTYLWGRAALPDGMTNAEYAHRGAYPLIVTALLAAVFVLAAMRRNGPAHGSPLIRGLVYAWIAQNILLCISSILRLEQYVEVYSLSEWRIAAGIWMGLVAAGLALILLRILFRRSNEWLVAMNLATLALTLYACAFVDFSALIADFNVRHSVRFTGVGGPPDIAYLNGLGPSAIPALDFYLAALAGRSDNVNDYDPRQVRQQLAARFAARSTDWRTWSFRDRRLGQYLAAHP